MAGIVHSNSFYFYLFHSEELMDLADEQGFLVIDEVPAVGLE